MSRRKENPQPHNRFSVLEKCEAVIDAEISRRLESANTAMEEINISPRSYQLSKKVEVAYDLNWAMRISLPPEDVTGTFGIGRTADQDEDECGIYLKPNQTDDENS